MSAALRSLLVAAVRSQKMISSQPVRHDSHGRFYYREIGQTADKRSIFLANLLGFTVWYWMMYKTYYEFGHIVGHFTYPDPAKWTDAELGIPEDD